MFPIARDHVAQSVLVTDDAIRQAQKALWDSVRVATEPGGAAAMAAILSGRYVPAAGERVAVLVCGSNTTDHEVGGVCGAKRQRVRESFDLGAVVLVHSASKISSAVSIEIHCCIPNASRNIALSPP